MLVYILSQVFLLRVILTLTPRQIYYTQRLYTYIYDIRCVRHIHTFHIMRILSHASEYVPTSHHFSML